MLDFGRPIAHRHPRRLLVHDHPSSSSKAAAQQRRRRQPKRATGQQRVRHCRGSGGTLTCQLRRRPRPSTAAAAAFLRGPSIFASGGGPGRRARQGGEGSPARAWPSYLQHPLQQLEPSCGRRPLAARSVAHRRPGAHCGACQQVGPGGGINVSRPLAAAVSHMAASDGSVSQV